jgi:hypothetical protein
LPSRLILSPVVFTTSNLEASEAFGAAQAPGAFFNGQREERCRIRVHRILSICNIQAEEIIYKVVKARMKMKLQRIVLAVLIAATATSCSTAYDGYGRPRTVVEPGAALLGAAAAGFAGYALANNSNRHDHGRRHHSRHNRHYTSYSGHRPHSSYYY